jgi:tetratricopeptide (TPR) repeat protein
MRKSGIRSEFAPLFAIRYSLFACFLLLTSCNRAPEYYFENGNRLALSGRTVEAVAMYNRAILLKKRYPEALTSRGLVYERLGDRQKARYDYEKAIELDASYAPAHNNLAALFMDIGDYREADRRLSAVLEIRPAYSHAYLNRGVCRYKLSDYAGALADLSKALELDPGLGLARYQRALCAAKLGYRAEAIADLDQLINAEPGVAAAWFERGRLKYNGNDLPGASEDFKKAVELKPGSPAYLYWLALAAARLGYYDGALENLELAFRIDPAYAQGWLLKGDIFARTKDPVRARESYLKAQESDPANARLYQGRIAALSPAARKTKKRPGGDHR